MIQFLHQLREGFAGARLAVGKSLRCVDVATLKVHVVAVAVGVAAGMPFNGTAATIVGGSALLDSAKANQLETWRNGGPVVLTNIFTHVRNDGKNSSHFHAAVDSKGPTFCVLKVNGSGGAIFGGYNPQSWNSSNDFTITGPDSERTAFLFNLTSNVKQAQRLGPGDGQFQTYNSASYGPTFGSGPDLHVDGISLNNVSTFSSSYGGGRGTADILGGTRPGFAQIERIEVFALDQPPVITCPGNITRSADPGSCSTAVSFAATATDNSPGAVTITYSPQQPGSAFGRGTTTVIATATDSAGNQSTCSFTVTVTDTQRPQIICPANINVPNDVGTCGANVTLGQAQATDNCGLKPSSPSFTRSDNQPPSSAFPIGTTTVTWHAEDLSGNSVTCDQTVIVTDSQRPQFVACGGDISVNTDQGACGANVRLRIPEATDNCAPPAVTGARSDGKQINELFPVGSTTVSWTATDAAGNSAVCSQVITVTDNELPEIVTPPSRTVNTDDNICSSTLGEGLPGQATAIDNCGVFSLTALRDDNKPLDAPYPLGTTTITWIAVDVNGNSNTVNQEVTVVDDEEPSIFTPQNIATNNDPGQCNATLVIEAPLAIDNCTTTRPAVGTRSDGKPLTDTYPVGETTITWYAQDEAGNDTSCVQNISVTDAEAPALEAPSNVTVNADSGLCSAASVAIGTASATDNCGVDSVTNDAPATYPVGTTDVTWTVTDIHNNKTEAVQTVTVLDAQNPTITCPAEVTVNTEPGKNFAWQASVSLGTPATADNCGLRPATNNAPAQYAFGANTVTWTVTDVNGNTAECNQQVTVVDVEPPSLTAPADVVVENTAGACSASGVVLGDHSAGDNVELVSVVNDAPASFPVGTTEVTWTATDSSGNTTEKSQQVTVQDRELPVVIAPADITAANNTGRCSAVDIALGIPETSDNCGVETVTNDAPAEFPVGTTPVTWTVKDIHGNEGTATQYVTVNDEEKPTIVCGDDISANTDAGVCSAAVTVPAPLTDDNCGVASVINSINGTADASGSYPVGITPITWTVTDDHGNTATCEQMVVVTDNESPVVNAPADIAVNNEAGNCSASVPFAASPTDNCGVHTTGYKIGETVITSPHVFSVGSHTVDVTVTDIHGNSSSSSFVVTVSDTEKPVVNAPADNSVTNDPGNCSASIEFAATPTDNCGVESTEYKIGAQVISSPHAFPVGSHTVDVTVTDIHGNSSASSFTVIVTDNERPVVNAPADIAEDNDTGNCSASVSFAASPSDNCGVQSTGYKLGATVISSPHVFTVGSHTVDVTVTDIHGNSSSSSFGVTVSDAEKPVVNAPSNIAVSNDAGNCSASVSYAATPTDNCGVQSTVYTFGAEVISSPHVFPVGIHSVDVTVTDIHGNSSSAPFTVTVSDDEKPVITCPADISIGCSTERLVSREFRAEAADNCGMNSIVYSIAGTPITSPHGFPIGTTKVDVTATDMHGNVSTCSFTVNRDKLGFEGFLAPIGGCVEKGNGGTSLVGIRPFKLGSTIPVKFRSSCSGSPIVTGIHTLQAIKYDSGTVSAPAIDATPTDAATTGNQFRSTATAAGEWHFNLSTKGTQWSAGTWMLKTTLSDGSTYSVFVDLKK